MHARQMTDRLLHVLLEIRWNRQRDAVVGIRVNATAYLERKVTAAVDDRQERDAIGELEDGIGQRQETRNQVSEFR